MNNIDEIIEQLKTSPQETKQSDIDELKKHPELIIKNFGLDDETLEMFGVESIINGIKILTADGKNVTEFSTLRLNVEQFHTLLTLKDIPKGLNVDITCRNASEISVQDLEKIDERFCVKSIFLIEENLQNEQMKPYSLKEYKMCRKKIDELCEGIMNPPLDDPDREKKIYTQVMLRLAKHMKYDSTFREDEDKAIKEGWSGQLDEITPRNMKGGLLEGKCVCAGYAEIVRNTLACLGIEATYVCGLIMSPDKPDEVIGHAWNQVYLDGKWYNMDLTLCRDDIVNGNSANLLVSDKDFETTGERNCGGHIHKPFVDRTLHACDETVPLDKYYILARHEEKVYNDDKKHWLRHSCEHIIKSAVRNVETFFKNVFRPKDKDYNKEHRD